MWWASYKHSLIQPHIHSNILSLNSIICHIIPCQCLPFSLAWQDIVCEENRLTNIPKFVGYNTVMSSKTQNLQVFWAVKNKIKISKEIKVSIKTGPKCWHLLDLTDVPQTLTFWVHVNIYWIMLFGDVCTIYIQSSPCTETLT